MSEGKWRLGEDFRVPIGPRVDAILFALGAKFEKPKSANDIYVCWQKADSLEIFPRTDASCGPWLNDYKLITIEDLERAVLGCFDDEIAKASSVPTSCECGKEKFGFSFHERWCPDWSDPMTPLVAMATGPAPVPSHGYMTEGDRRAAR